MSLIKCPECGKEISDIAESCPNCGYPIKRKLNSNSSIKLNEVNKKNHKKSEMQTARLIVSIIMLVLSIFVLFQSAAVGMANSIDNPTGDDGTIGLMFGLSMIVFGIIGIATKNTKSFKTLLTVGLIMVLVGVYCAVIYSGRYGDLKVWGWVMSIFGLIFSISGGNIRENRKMSGGD